MYNNTRCWWTFVAVKRVNVPRDVQPLLRRALSTSASRQALVFTTIAMGVAASDCAGLVAVRGFPD